MSDNPNAVLEATESFVTEINGTHYSVAAGLTRIRASHELNQNYPAYFRPVEEGLTYGLEEATDNPGEVRNRPVPSEPTRVEPTPEPEAEAEKTGPKPRARAATSKST